MLNFKTFLGLVTTTIGVVACVAYLACGMDAVVAISGTSAVIGGQLLMGPRGK